MAQLSSDGAALRIRLRLGLGVRQMDRLSLQHAAPANRAAHGGDHVPNWRKDRAVVGDHYQTIALEAENRSVIGTAKH